MWRSLAGLAASAIARKANAKLAQEPTTTKSADIPPSQFSFSRSPVESLLKRVSESGTRSAEPEPGFAEHSSA
eukprot:2500548-Pleurochrysis_carterae.AAC.1